MKRKCDWVRGGDPLKTTWLEESSSLALHSVEWETQAYLSYADFRINIDKGLTPSGEKSLLRIKGRVPGASRQQEAQVGWILSKDEELQLPSVSEQEWSEGWKYWLTSSAPDIDQLIQGLGIMKTTEPSFNLINESPATEKGILKCSRTMFTFLVALLALIFSIISLVS